MPQKNSWYISWCSPPMHHVFSLHGLKSALTYRIDMTIPPIHLSQEVRQVVSTWRIEMNSLSHSTVCVAAGRVLKGVTPLWGDTVSTPNIPMICPHLQTEDREQIIICSVPSQTHGESRKRLKIGVSAGCAAEIDAGRRQNMRYKLWGGVVSEWPEDTLPCCWRIRKLTFNWLNIATRDQCTMQKPEVWLHNEAWRGVGNPALPLHCQASIPWTGKTF